MRLQLQGIGKNFGVEPALRGVDLALTAGAAVAVVGGRGAGKSLLAAMIAGALRPDMGRIWLDGRPFAPRDPAEARKAGVSVVREQPALALHLSVAQNLALGAEPARYGWISASRRRAAALLALAALRSEDIPLDLPSAWLSPPQRRRVQIARALMGRPRLIVLDEPGQSGRLSALDLENLFAALRARAREGAAVLVLTRSLEAAYSLGGHIALLREGALVGFSPAATLDRGRALSLLGGEPPAAFAPPERTLWHGSRHHGEHHVGDAVLELRGASTARLPGPVDLTLHKGEILGLAGLPGAGRTALLRAIYGLDMLTAGTLLLDGRVLAAPGKKRRAGSGGMALAGPELDAGEGLLPTRSIVENLTLSRLPSLAMGGCFSCERRLAAAMDWMEKLHLQARHPYQPAGDLPRGNRRKLAVGRLLQGGTRFLLLDDPASGLDATTRAQIHDWIAVAAAEGRSVVLASEAFPELLSLCDTVAVLRRGKTAAVRPAADWTSDSLRSAAAGALNRRFAPSL